MGWDSHHTEAEAQPRLREGGERRAKVPKENDGEEGGPPLFSVGVSATTKPFHESRILHTKPGHGAKPSKAQKLSARYVVWAAGEFQYPATESASAVEGAELCMHNSMVRSWASLPGDDFVLIGGCVHTSLRDLP